MMEQLGWILFGGGGLLCLLNFHLSFLRYPLHRMRGGSPDAYRHVSGSPLVASGLTAVGWGLAVSGRASPFWNGLAIVLIALDTGGIHWFVASQLLEALTRRRAPG